MVGPPRAHKTSDVCLHYVALGPWYGHPRAPKAPGLLHEEPVEGTRRMRRSPTAVLAPWTPTRLPAPWMASLTGMKDRRNLTQRRHIDLARVASSFCCREV
ncbi:putative leader peptide [Streptomyces sp. NPDC001876]|uniref:putative leader peptide n=1 Tax=Streptomyces sp. NPDC001876 TaxID=3154402 RepID=UPI00332ED24C